MGTGWSWLRIGTDGGHLWVRCGTFVFHKCGEFLDWWQSLLVSFSRRTLLHGVSTLPGHCESGRRIKAYYCGRGNTAPGVLVQEFLSYSRHAEGAPDRFSVIPHRNLTVFAFQKVVCCTSRPLCLLQPNSQITFSPQSHADITASTYQRDRHIFSLLSQLTFVLPQHESQRV